MLMRLYELVTFENKLKQLENVGQQNLSESLEKEPGTLFMLIASNPTNPFLKYVLEIYKDEAAYLKHRSSAHFQTFTAFAQEGLSSRNVITLQPEFAFEDETIKQIIRVKGAIVNLFRVTISPNDADFFQAIDLKEMATEIETGEGILAFICGSDTEDKSQWYFFYVYENKEACTRHKLYSSDKQYMKKLKNIVEELAVYELIIESMMSQGKLGGENEHD